MTLRPLLAAGLALLPALASAGSLQVLPEAWGRLLAARYAPSDPDLKWTAWLGGGFALARVGGTTLAFDADVETIIGGELRVFDANQANYHLVASARHAFGPTTVALFFDHTSRHLVDRAKTQAVDWNLWAVQVSRPLGDALPFPVRASLRVGRAVQDSLVRYGWETIGRVQAEPVGWTGGAFYVDLALRHVSAEATEALPRDGFVDTWAEAGVRLRRGSRRLEPFVAHEHRNDVFLEAPGARSRVLFGLRIVAGSGGGDLPALGGGVPAPTLVAPADR